MAEPNKLLTQTNISALKIGSSSPKVDLALVIKVSLKSIYFV